MSDMNRRDFARMGLGGFAVPAVGQAFQGDRSAADRLAESLALQGTGVDRAYRYVHLDVFTDQRLAGNQLLVYTQPGNLSTEAMQGLTRESNYSENTFVLPPEQPGTEYRV